MIIHGKAVFTCPQTKKEIPLKACLNSDGKGTQCMFFKHWSWTSDHPWVACDYKQPIEEAQQEEKPEEEQTEKEPEDLGEEREWRQPQFIEE